MFLSFQFIPGTFGGNKKGTTNRYMKRRERRGEAHGLIDACREGDGGSQGGWMGMRLGIR